MINEGKPQNQPPGGIPQKEKLVLPENLGSETNVIPLLGGLRGFRREGKWYMVRDGTVTEARGSTGAHTEELYQDAIPGEVEVEWDGKIKGMGLAGQRAFRDFKELYAYSHRDPDARKTSSERFLQIYLAGKNKTSPPEMESHEREIKALAENFNDIYEAGGIDNNLQVALQQAGF